MSDNDTAGSKWGGVRSSMEKSEAPFTLEEFQGLFPKYAPDAVVIAVQGEDKDASLYKIKEVMPEITEDAASNLLKQTELYGPALLSKDEDKSVTKDVILAGHTSHTDALMHELGHIIDYNTGSDRYNKFKIDSYKVSNRLNKANIPLIGGVGLALTKKLGLAAPLLPWIVKAPILRSETAANGYAYNLIKKEKGVEAAERYRKNVDEAYGKLFDKPITQSTIIGGVALTALLNRKGFFHKAKGLLKKSELEKHGTPSSKYTKLNTLTRKHPCK